MIGKLSPSILLILRFILTSGTDKMPIQRRGINRLESLYAS